MSEAEEPSSLIPVWSFLRTLYSYRIRILLEESKLKDILMEVQAREGQWAEAYRKVRRSKCACTEICHPHSCHMKLTQTPCICFSILCTFFKSLLMTCGKVPFTLIFHSSNAPSSLKSFPKYYLLIETYYHNKNNWHLLLNSQPVLPSEDQRLMATYHCHNYSSLTKPHMYHDCIPLGMLTVLRSVEVAVSLSSSPGKTPHLNSHTSLGDLLFALIFSFMKWANTISLIIGLNSYKEFRTLPCTL